jgi:lipoprotein-anchoring transpeptidase ErfK/SrfK
MVGSRVAVDSPISSGRRNGWTPKGSFQILEKDPNHFSNLYGNFVDGTGTVIRSGVSSKIDSAPSGTHFRGAPMKYFLRLTPQGVGMHAGILPGYPASHGCIRLPVEMAQIIYSKVTLNTPVTVGE